MNSVRFHAASWIKRIDAEEKTAAASSSRALRQSLAGEIVAVGLVARDRSRHS